MFYFLYKIWKILKVVRFIGVVKLEQVKRMHLKYKEAYIKN